MNRRFPTTHRFGCALLTAALLFALASPALASPVRCTTYEEKTPGPPAKAVRRRHAGGVNLEPDVAAVDHHRHAAAGQRCTGQLNLKTRQVEVHC